VLAEEKLNEIRAKLKHSFLHQWLYSPLLGPGLYFSFLIFFTQTLGLLGRGISPSQGRYLHTGKHKHSKNANTDIHALSGIRIYDPSVRASEDSSCLRPRGHCDRLITTFSSKIPETISSTGTGFNHNIMESN
jgi:hypothetical protein